jgi:hypothetical protein
MRSINFSYEGVTIRVESHSSPDLCWLQEFLHPWFDPSDALPDICVEWTADPARFRKLLARGKPGEMVPAFMMDTRIIHYPMWSNAGASRVLFDEERALFMQVEDRRIAIIADRWQPGSRTQVMRVVRELAMGAAQARGGRFLHASAVSLDGKAIIMAGRRMAGKTSLLTYLLSNLDAALLTNDRLLIHPQSNNITFRGMPTIVSIRGGTLGLFPRLQERIRQNCYATRLTLEECKSADQSVFENRSQGRQGLSPAQFCAATGSRPARDARGGVLLFPRQTGSPGGISLQQMNTEETRAALLDGLFGHIGPDRLSEVFTLPESCTRTVPDWELLDTLSTSLPAYQCRLGQDAYADKSGADQIRKLI